jgi:hypothetical protein
MNLAIVIPSVGVICFVGGVVFSKALLHEASDIKAHVTAEIAKLRGDISAAVKAKL